MNNNGITIIIPENNTHTNPMNVYYPATYSFDKNNEGDDPKGWFIDDESAGNIEVISEIVGHYSPKLYRFFKQ